MKHVHDTCTCYACTHTRACTHTHTHTHTLVGGGEGYAIHVVIYSKQFDKSLAASRRPPSSGGKLGHVIRPTKEATPDQGSRKKVSGNFYVIIII